MCEGCGLKRANYGLASEGKARWCAGCGKTKGASRSKAGVPNEAAWEAQLAKLAAYKAAHGDCKVPQRWAEDPRLGSWVDNQRKRKKALDRGKYGDGMTAARAAKLEALGFA